MYKRRSIQTPCYMRANSAQTFSAFENTKAKTKKALSHGDSTKNVRSVAGCKRMLVRPRQKAGSVVWDPGWCVYHDRCGATPTECINPNDWLATISENAKLKSVVIENQSQLAPSLVHSWPFSRPLRLQYREFLFACCKRCPKKTPPIK